jgi:glutamate formiminotransferase
MVSILECVPNCSEGRDPAFLEDVRGAVSQVHGVALLDSSADPDHHRSVFTLAGAPDVVSEALFEIAKLAVERIDLRSHHGTHPRMGALDVAPFVPLGDMGSQHAIEAARRFALRLWEELAVPSYFYGLAATTPARQRLENVRRGGFEALLAGDASRVPDVGGPRLHPTAGATAVGVRKPLIAWNVELATADAAPARRIAWAIRESSGGLPGVRALGLALPTRHTTQVSMNLVDYERTGPKAVFDRIGELAAAEGVAVIDSELIGLIPRGALGQDGGESLRIRGFRPSMILEDRIEAALGVSLG